MKNKKVNKEKDKGKCPKCMGVGWWPIGSLCPIGPMDAAEWGNKVIKCPWCNAGFVDTGERYKTLKKVKENETKKS